MRTKLRRPPIPHDVVSRSRITTLLDRAAESPLAVLTLVSAAAGYGKSTLVSHWIETSTRRCAWLSLGEAESDLRTFTLALVASVRLLQTDTLDETTRLARHELPSVPALGRCLVNELEALGSELVLVLDDYHRLDAAALVHDLLRFVLDHPPRPLRLVIVTRRDPPLPLASMRALGRLAEIRAPDLRFTDVETTEFLARTSTVSVTRRVLDRLQGCLEGWAVGLRLLAIHLRHVAHPDRFLEELRGNLPATHEYLIEQVLADQSTAMRDWLLKTAVLDRFGRDLCEALCRPHRAAEADGLDGHVFLETLRSGNLFLVPLDDAGEWFRYHHLFQDLLHEQLERHMHRDEIAGLHTVASRWFEAEGLIDDAIRHALSAGATELAADIVERHRRDELDADRWYVVDRWLGKLSQESSQQRPGLILAQAWTRYFRFQLGAISPLLERLAPLADRDQLPPGLASELDFFRGHALYWEGNADASLRYLEASRAHDGRRHGVIAGNREIFLALARLMNGEAGLASTSLGHQLDGVEASDGVFRSHLLGGLLFIHLLAGHLHQARVESEYLDVGGRHDGDTYAVAWAAYTQGCSYLQTGEWQAALTHFGHAISERYILHRQAAVDALAGLALTEQLMGRTSEATRALGSMRSFALETGERRCLDVVESCHARLRLLRGELGPAREWAHSMMATPSQPELFFWLEVPPLTQVRALIASGTRSELDKARALLGAIRQISETCRYTCQTIEATVLEALALEKQTRSEEALRVLERAVNLARPGGWVRPFVEPGPTMTDMLVRLSKTRGDDGYLGRLVDACGAQIGGPEDPGSGRDPVIAGSALDALTQRELDILECLDERLQNKEIADRLFISPHTVNDHLKRIYRKLGVHTRRQAVIQARVTGLLAGARRSRSESGRPERSATAPPGQAPGG